MPLTLRPSKGRLGHHLGLEAHICLVAMEFLSTTSCGTSTVNSSSCLNARALIAPRVCILALPRALFKSPLLSLGLRPSHLLCSHSRSQGRIISLHAEPLGVVVALARNRWDWTSVIVAR